MNKKKIDSQFTYKSIQRTFYISLISTESGKKEIDDGRNKNFFVKQKSEIWNLYLTFHINAKKKFLFISLLLFIHV